MKCQIIQILKISDYILSVCMGLDLPIWAYCYRKYLGVNCNMHLESMHKIIKYFYLDGC